MTSSSFRFTVDDIFDYFRNNAKNTAEKGTFFEIFCKQFFLCSPVYNQNIEDVWLWNEWPGKSGHDIGVDLVIKRKTGEFAAIQCKFYSTGQIDKPAIDSFLSAAGGKFNVDGEKIQFAETILVATAPIGPNAATTLRLHNSIVVDKDRLENSGVDWKKFWQEYRRLYIETQAGGNIDASVVQTAARELRPHQETAVRDVLRGFAEHDRGKLIMACGTGKTLTSLRIAEKAVPERGCALYLVPSLALLGQTLNEWSVDRKRQFASVLVCSDSEIHIQSDAALAKMKLRKEQEEADGDVEIDGYFELPEQATTDAALVGERVAKCRKSIPEDGLVVVFSTYHSIQTVIDAQKEHGVPEFDLVICDEAHRTTGTSLGGQDESAFTKVHNQALLAAKKRLYMTATPKIYASKEVEKVKAKAKENRDESFALCSMDDESIYGPVFHALSFRKAVSQGLLSDYKVAILVVDSADAAEQLAKVETMRREHLIKGLPQDVDNHFAPPELELDADDQAKLVGCWRGLSKSGRYRLANGLERNDFESDPTPMRRAVCFARSIKKSKALAEYFGELCAAVKNSDSADKLDDASLVNIQIDHIDGSMGAQTRNKKLAWLKEEIPAEKNVCRILSNVRCLSEGVDCPSLDAVLFFSPRKSRIDVVQAVGRVMRRAPGKKFGYIIIPIVVDANVAPEVALDDNERYRVVWEVLQAIRSHDENFAIACNQITYNDGKLPSDRIILDIGGTKGDPAPDESEEVSGEGGKKSGRENGPLLPGYEEQIRAQKLADIICAKIAQKCGDRNYLEDWAKKVAAIADSFRGRLDAAFRRMTPEQAAAVEDVRARLELAFKRPVDAEEVVETAKSHFVTTPIFDAFFQGVRFTDTNPVAKAFQDLLTKFSEAFTEPELDALDELRAAVAINVAGIEDAKGKQAVLKTFYEKFFKEADKKAADRLGVVYTPEPVVDFILRSVDWVAKKEFGKRAGLGSRDVNILDPFVGTGTFIARLIGGDFIENPESLRRKYGKNLWANEISLLPYYIAAANIETEYAARNGGRRRPFPGIVLTDTFNATSLEHETERRVEELPPLLHNEEEIAAAGARAEEEIDADNDERLKAERKSVIEIIVGNPPYSVGQRSGNDNNQNQKYEALDKRVEKTYVAGSKAANKNALYDSYVKAFRWASDRIPKDAGIIGFVSNGAFVDNAAFSGFRKCLVDEFTSVYVFNLRGDARCSGELRRKEKDNVFGEGTRTPVAITILIRNAKRAKDGFVHYCAVPDYQTREDKLNLIQKAGSIADAEREQPVGEWRKITPDENGDWINKRDTSFNEFIVLGSKDDKSADSFFQPVYSSGLKTGRDAWCFNFSKEKLIDNMRRTIEFYNSQVDAYAALEPPRPGVADFVEFDSKKGTWNWGLLNYCQKAKRFNENPINSVRISVYRPFNKSYLFFNQTFNDRVYQIPKLFPTSESKNLLICVPGPGGKKEFAPLMVSVIPDLHFNETTQCFPLYYYESYDGNPLFAPAQRSAITEFALSKARDLYGAETTPEDVFFYVYGALHAQDYRERYANDLRKSLPRLPFPPKAATFRRFSNAGRRLANLCLNYDGKNVPIMLDGKELAPPEPYPVTVTGAESGNFRVEKIKWAKKGDFTRLIYNENIVISGIPEEAEKYVVNGRSPLGWVIDRYQIKTDPASGIVNDPNEWAPENPQYILDLIPRLVTVSLETLKIVKELPKLL